MSCSLLRAIVVSADRSDGKRLGLRLGCLSLAVALVLAGCGGSAATTDATTSSGPAWPTSSDYLTGTVHVFAAASLQEAFTALGAQFEREHPGTAVVFNFGPSSGLAEQIRQGAPADVFAAASRATMESVVAGGHVTTPTDFAANTMQIAVPPDNPAGIGAVEDLATSGVKVALCQADVPCGAAALQVFDKAGIEVTPVTEEIDVKAALSKVRLGEVDAGVVYVTDVRAAGDAVKGIEIPDEVNASTTYPIAAVTGSDNRATAQAFVELVRSADGSAALREAGFGTP